MRTLKLLVLCTLTACAPKADPEVTMRAASPATLLDLPAMKTFGPARVPHPGRANGEIAQDFLDLEFRMESGRPLAVFSRFETPITVALRGAVPATAPTDLAALIGRLRAEAGIDLRQTTGAGAITFEFLPRDAIRATFANVACFVVPGVSSWAGYRAAQGAAKLDWGTVTARETVAIFLPSDTSPQEVRDCLHEELAQAMGPLNDLYSLSDSVFNDDNFHTVLTGFDMLILRLHYAPELHSGMTRAEVAARLPALLARLNPAGQHPGTKPADATPRGWISAIETALGAGAPARVRRAGAAQALAIARRQGWHDSRLALSLFAHGRLSIGIDPTAAVTALAEAARLYRSLPEGGIHAAHVDMQLAALALSRGDVALALALADQAIPVVMAAQNAALLATLLMVKAEALSAMGRSTESAALRLDSLGWARYGFGPEAVVRARMSEIGALRSGDLPG